MNEYFKASGNGSWRRRLAPVLLLLGLASASKVTFDATPREQHVQLRLPEQLRAQLSSIRLTYLEGNEAVSGTEQRFSEGAPATLSSRPELSPGEYQLDVELAVRSGKVRHSRHNVSVPSEGTVRIQLPAWP